MLNLSTGVSGLTRNVNERFEASFLSSPGQYLDQAVGRQNIVAGIHTIKKPTGSTSGVHLPDLCLLSKETQKLAGVIQAVGAFKRGAATAKIKEPDHGSTALPASALGSARKTESSTTVDLINNLPPFSAPTEFDSDSEIDVELCFDDIALSVTAATLQQGNNVKNPENEGAIDTVRMLKDEYNRIDYTENSVSDVSLMR